MAQILGAAGLRHFVKFVRVRSIDIFGRSKDEYRVWLHLPQQVDRALNICAKAILSVGGVLA